ncbi:MAG: hypothetical protein K2M41_07505, partial [Muribaculaceae bacterium]|nr:hypothetical protein [Muribaculaceae bacterium]
ELFSLMPSGINASRGTCRNHAELFYLEPAENRRGGWAKQKNGGFLKYFIEIPKININFVG